VKFIAIPLPPHLPAFWPEMYAKRVESVAVCTTQDHRSVYIRKNGSWGLLKTWLASASGDKCWYCEANNTRAPFDVDHFRPKLGITVDGVKLPGHHGYYWLAYEWWNFRLSCQRCNRSENDAGDTLRGKANEFPIKDEAQRCSQPAGVLTGELPRLLDPCVQDDCGLLAHGIDGEVKPAAPTGTWEFKRARYTIDRLGFNEWNAPETKKKSWRLLDDLIRLAGHHPVVVARLQEHLANNQEYSSFFRSAIGTHRDKAWVEALL